MLRTYSEMIFLDPELEQHKLAIISTVGEAKSAFLDDRGHMLNWRQRSDVEPEV